MRLVPLITHGTIRAFTAVDDEDYEALNQDRWAVDQTGYAFRAQYVRGSGRQNQRQIRYRMHRVVMGLAPSSRDDPRQVDHINGNRLDNRKSNLRIVTHAEQAQNRTNFRRGSSQFRGVQWSKHAKRWTARVWTDGKPTNLGYFTDEIEAALCAHRARSVCMPFAEPDPYLVKLGVI